MNNKSQLGVTCKLLKMKMPDSNSVKTLVFKSLNIDQNRGIK